MTFAIFFIAFIALFFAGLNFLPNAEPLPSGFVTGFSEIIASMKAWNAIFPITELFVLVALVTAFWLAIWFFRVIKWVIHIVRGSGTQ